MSKEITKDKVIAMISEIDEVCKKHGIDFYLDYDFAVNALKYKGVTKEELIASIDNQGLIVKE